MWHGLLPYFQISKLAGTGSSFLGIQRLPLGRLMPHVIGIRPVFKSSSTVALCGDQPRMPWPSSDTYRADFLPHSSAGANERLLNQMFRKKPDLHFVRADYIAHQQVIRPIITSFGGLLGHRSGLKQNDLVRME